MRKRWNILFFVHKARSHNLLVVKFFFESNFKLLNSKISSMACCSNKITPKILWNDCIIINEVTTDRNFFIKNILVKKLPFLVQNWALRSSLDLPIFKILCLEEKNLLKKFMRIFLLFSKKNFLKCFQGPTKTKITKYEYRKNSKNLLTQYILTTNWNKLYSNFCKCTHAHL